MIRMEKSPDNASVNNTPADVNVPIVRKDITIYLRAIPPVVLHVIVTQPEL